MSNRRKEVPLPSGVTVTLRPLTAGQFIGFGRQAQKEGAEAEFEILSASIESPAMTPAEAAEMEIGDYLVLQREIRIFNGIGTGALPLPETQQPG